MKTKKDKSIQSMGTGAGSLSEALSAALVSSGKPLLAVAKSELVRACGAGLVAYAPRDWSPNRRQWSPVSILRGARGAGRSIDQQEQEKLAAAPVVNEARRAFESARANDERAAIAAELRCLRAARVAALAAGAGEVVAMAPLGEGKGSKSRALIDRAGEAGEDEARQCFACFRQRVEFDGAALAFAAGQLGERFARRWLRKREIASGRTFEASTREDIISIYRGAGVDAVQLGGHGLLGSRRAVKAASKAAYSEVHKSTGRGGLETRLEVEFRGEFKAHGTIARLPSSAPDQGAGSGLRPSVVGELASWGEQVRQAAAAKIAAASTPAAKGNAREAAARRVALIQGLFDYVKGGAPLDPDLLAEFFDGGPQGGLTQKGHKRIQRMRKALS